MNCHFPWSSELWEAENPISFSKIVTAHSAERPLPLLREVATQLLEAPEDVKPITWGLSLSAEHLLILIYALNSLAFQTRAGLLRYPSFERIRQAADSWKRLWDCFIGQLDKEQFLHLGYPKHAEELWWLLTATLDITTSHDANFAYLDSTATDELGNLNDFIQWCYRNAS
ncbi:transcriptional regulator family: Fungal Specific TF [Penicillium alfredii]|uniref:Transcriptional regulator family: Fungal Specific TF n=1 Tax=Penicillium alfredii TaxID=1506179 RepID=A0A9W9GBK2_9EURO|nr:transcriptional regulator family: Fungal Specific TF [Penicillium alfredii]KAJ5115147.1 transcriptional regulator family: Fungal Specific TF [Penicillium alfredii]